ncbi:MAG: hypothetical protein Q4D38_04830 [Planctomycetia bacterium]|nr:hypothetical protein [Planctomycetia bacterium]
MFNTDDSAIRIGEELQQQTAQIVSQLRAREEQLARRESELAERQKKFESEEARKTKELQDRESELTQAALKLAADTENLELRVKKLLDAERNYETRCQELEGVQSHLEARAASLDEKEGSLIALQEEARRDQQVRLREVETLKEKLVAERENFERESKEQFEAMRVYLQKQRDVAKQILNDAAEQARSKMEQLVVREEALEAAERRLCEREKAFEEERLAQVTSFSELKKELNEQFRVRMQEKAEALEQDWMAEAEIARNEIQCLKKEAEETLLEARKQANILLQDAEARVQNDEEALRQLSEAKMQEVQGRADFLLQNAQAEADSFLQSAQAKADFLLQNAQAEADLLLQNTQAKVRNDEENRHNMIQAQIEEARTQAKRLIEEAQCEIAQKMRDAQLEIEAIKQEAFKDLQDKTNLLAEQENELTRLGFALEKERGEVREKHVQAIQEAKRIVSEANEKASALLGEIEKRAATILEDAQAQASFHLSQIEMERKKLERERSDFHSEMELRRANLEQEMLAAFEENYKSQAARIKQRESALIQQEVKNAKLEAAEIVKIAREQADAILQSAQGKAQEIIVHAGQTVSDSQSAWRLKQSADRILAQTQEKAQELQEKERQLESMARKLREKQEALNQREATLADVRAEMEALAYELVDDRNNVRT